MIRQISPRIPNRHFSSARLLDQSRAVNRAILDLARFAISNGNANRSSSVPGF